nr:MAG TPA: cell division protein [Caudoviricetes sp.]
MYEKIKIYLETLKSKVTIKRLIIGALCVLFLYGIGSLASGYFAARANYQRAIERLEQTQRALDESRRLNRELNKIIETSRQLNHDAGERINRIEGYQQRENTSIERIESNQRETGARVRESLEQNNRARAEIKSSLELIRRIEERNKK